MADGLILAVTSDSHIGRRYPTLDFREGDINQGFELLMGSIADENPDVLIHAGDLFDTVFPPGWIFELGLSMMQSMPHPSREITIREEQTGRTDLSNIFIIHGNHDGTADARCESGYFSTLKYFDSMSLCNYMDVRKEDENIYLPRYTIEGAGVKVGLQGLGHRSVSQFQNVFPIAEPIKGVDHNILVIHQSLADLTTPYTRGELLPMDIFAERGFDIVVAGHTHKPLDDSLRDTRFIVPGSSERIDSGEYGERKGYYTLTLTRGDLECGFRAIDVDRIRKIRKYEVDVDGLSGSEITEQCIRSVTEPDISEALIYFVVRGQTPHGHVDVDRSDIEERLTERGARATKVNTERVMRKEIGELVSDDRWKTVRINAETFRRLFSERNLRDLTGTPIRDEAVVSLLSEAAYGMYIAVERDQKEDIPPVLEKELLAIAEALHPGEEEAG